MTLTEYIQKQGSLEKAGAMIGVSGHTVWRWKNGKTRPHGLSRARLLMLGIELDETKSEILAEEKRTAEDAKR